MRRLFGAPGGYWPVVKRASETTLVLVLMSPLLVLCLLVPVAILALAVGAALEWVAPDLAESWDALLAPLWALIRALRPE